MLSKLNGREFKIQFMRQTPKTFAILYEKVNGSFITTGLVGISKCNKLDKFDKYVGKRRAMNNLMKQVRENLFSTKEEREAFWTEFYLEFGRR